MNNTAATAPQGQTQDVFNQTNQNVLAQNQQQALLQQLQQATASQYVPQGAGNQTQQPGQLPTPLYDFQNMYAPMQAISQAQLGNIQQNVVKQQSLRSLSSEGYQGVTAAIDLYKKVKHKKSDASGYADAISTAPGGFLFPRRQEEILSMVGTARSRVHERYRGSLDNLSGRYASSTEVAALNMGREALIDYAAGMIINSQTSTNPFMDASVMEATARAQARELVDAYTSLLPKKKINSEKDLEKLVNYINGYSPNDDSDLYLFQDSLNKIGGEYAYVDSYANDIRKHASEDRAIALARMNDPDADRTPVMVGDLPLPPEQKVAVGYVGSALSSMLDGLERMEKVVPQTAKDIVKGAGKGAASEVKKIAQVGASIVGSAIDLFASGNTAETTSPVMRKIQSIGTQLDEMLAPKEGTAEQIGDLAARAMVMTAVGASVVPAASLPIQAAYGVGASMGLQGVVMLGSGIGHTILDLIYSGMDKLGLGDNDHPSREIFSNIIDSVANVAAIYAMHRMSSYGSLKSVTLWDAIEAEGGGKINQLEPSIRDRVIREAKKINLQDVIKEFSDIDYIDGLKGRETPYAVAAGTADLLKTYPALAESEELMRFGREASLKEATNALVQALKAKDPTFSGSTAESMGQTAYEKISAMKKTNSAVFDEALGVADPIYRPSSELLNENIIDQIINPSSSSSKVRDGMIKGLGRYQEKLYKMDNKSPQIRAQIGRINDLKEAIGKRDLIEIRRAINSLDQLPHTVLQDLVVGLASEYVEGETAYYSSNQQIMNAKETVKEQLYAYMSEDQKTKYDYAGGAHSIFKDMLLLFEQSTKKGGIPPVESTQILNKFSEYSKEMSNLKQKAISKGMNPEFLVEMDKIEDYLLYYPVLQKFGRNPHFTATTLNSLKEKVQGTSFDKAEKANVLNALDFLAHFSKEFSTDLNRTHTGVYAKGDPVSQIVTQVITGMANTGVMGKLSGAARWVTSLLTEYSGIQKADGRTLGILLDTMLKNPTLVHALKFVVENYSTETPATYFAKARAPKARQQREED